MSWPPWRVSKGNFLSISPLLEQINWGVIHLEIADTSSPWPNSQERQKFMFSFALPFRLPQVPFILYTSTFPFHLIQWKCNVQTVLLLKTKKEDKVSLHVQAYHLFQDQYLAQMTPPRAIPKQTSSSIFAAPPPLAGLNKWSSGETSPKPI